MIMVVANDGTRRSTLTEYLNNHPAEAEKLRASVRRTIEQYGIAQSVMEGTAKQLAEVRERIYESFRSTYLPVLSRLAKQLEAIYPANWPRPAPDFGRIEEVLETDGIPIVHIPRAEIVQVIADAPDYNARIQIVEERADDIAEDCKTALDRAYYEGLEKQLPLARRAVETYRAEYYEAAQALAVSVCDTYLKRLFNVGYKKIAEELAIAKSDDASVAWAYNVHYALVPGVQFLVEWWPGDGGEAPTRLSRHVSIHNASTDQMTKLNATVAIMLVTGMSVAIDYAINAAATE
jgi:hypothetical protein